MKKIITLVFSVGLLTTAFAQQGSRQQNDPRSNGYTNRANSRPVDNGMYNRNGQYDNRGNQNQYGNNQYDRDGYQHQYNNRYGRDRYGRMKTIPRYYQPPVRYNNYPYQTNRRSPGILQLIFSIGGHR